MSCRRAGARRRESSSRAPAWGLVPGPSTQSEPHRKANNWGDRPRAREKPMPPERTVHVVDDDAAVRRSLERLLSSAGFAAVSYPTPEAILDAAPGLAAGC